MSIGIGNEHEVSPFQVVLGVNEVLRVTADGQFVWNPNADRMIEEGGFSFSPAMPYILRALRKRTWVGLTDDEIEALASWWPSYDQMPALKVLIKDVTNSLKEKNQ